MKGNSKFKGKVEKFEEEVKQVAVTFKPSEKKVVNLFAFDKSKIESLKEIKKLEEKKTETKPSSGGLFVFNPSVSVKFNFKAVAEGVKKESKDEKTEPKILTESQEEEGKSDTVSENVETVEEEPVAESYVQPIENSQSNSDKLFQKQIESMTS